MYPSNSTLPGGLTTGLLQGIFVPIPNKREFQLNKEEDYARRVDF
jgi:hypothetical protein